MTSRVRLLAVFTAFVGLIAACGGGTSPATSASATTQPAVTTTPGGTATTSVGADDRPVAPDFTLTLEPEGEFVLSEAAKPVYLVFWAEW